MDSSVNRTEDVDELGVNSQAAVQHSGDYSLLTGFP